MADRILILGASARAAAASARRAGLEPFAVDLFADRDTQLLCEQVWRCPPDEYPAGLFRLAEQVPPMPWMYTGGLENYPDLVGELAGRRELWGNGPDVLRTVRDPWYLRASINATSITWPECLRPGDPIPAGRWVRKDRQSSAGLGVSWAAPAGDDRPSARSDDVRLERFVSGPSWSATFASDGENHTLFGITHQLVGEQFLHAPPFRYAGSIGPVYPGRHASENVWVAGRVMTREFGLKGLWGMDFALSNDVPVIFDINPRYPAGAEVADPSTKYRQLYFHQRSIVKRNGLAEVKSRSGPPDRIFGKAIYYAPQRLTVPASGPWDDSLCRAADVWNRPDFADIPHPGDVIEPGHPVLTILTDADTESDCLARLRTRAVELDRLFGHTTNPGL